MRRRGRSATLVFLLCFSCSLSSIRAVDFGLNPHTTQIRNGAIDEKEEFVLEAINQLRSERGLSLLRLDPKLCEVARTHSGDMAASGYFSHVNPAGRGLKERLGATLAERGIFAGENIQKNDYEDSARVAVESWVRSPGHLQNILNERYSETGIGVAVNSDGVVFFTQVFLGK